MTDTLLWVDIETTGLDPESDKILEVGLAATDLELNIIDTVSVLTRTGYTDYLDLLRRDREVIKMHTKSKLIDEFEEAQEHTLGFYEDHLYEFLEAHIDKGKSPMCGSSVQFDRSFLKIFMPRVEDYFHYRNVDISSIKETCRRYNPRVYSKLPEGRKQHRVIPDLEDSINEFKFYLDNFMYVSY